MPRHERPNPDTDPFQPPAIPTEVWCLHCGREYQSYLIEWHEEVIDGQVHGFWCCPTPGCDGKGFGFDIFPTDPEYRNEHGEPMGFFEGDADDEDEDFFDDELSDDDAPEDSDALTPDDWELAFEDELLGDVEDVFGPADPDALPPIDLDDHRGRSRRIDDEDDLPW